MRKRIVLSMLSCEPPCTYRLLPADADDTLEHPPTPSHIPVEPAEARSKSAFQVSRVSLTGDIQVTAYTRHGHASTWRRNRTRRLRVGMQRHIGSIDGISVRSGESFVSSCISPIYSLKLTSLLKMIFCSGKCQHQNA